MLSPIVRSLRRPLGDHSSDVLIGGRDRSRKSRTRAFEAHVLVEVDHVRAAVAVVEAEILPGESLERRLHEA